MAIEIVDSRYRDFRFSASDVVADNAAACGFVIGPWQAVPHALGGLAVTLEIDGAVAVNGNTSSILDDPLQALCSCAQLAARAGCRRDGAGRIGDRPVCDPARPTRAGADRRAGGHRFYCIVHLSAEGTLGCHGPTVVQTPP